MNAPNTPVESMSVEAAFRPVCTNGNTKASATPTRLAKTTVRAGTQRVPLKMPSTGGSCTL